MSTPVPSRPPETHPVPMENYPMKRLNPTDLELALLPASTPTFADIISRIAADASLSPLRARDMISGLRRVAKAVGRSPDRVPADLRWLQPRLRKVSPASLDISIKSWSNAVSDARAALTHVGLAKPRLNHQADLRPDWRRLWTLVLASKNHTLAVSLGRFAHFLNKLGVDPNDVCDDHAAAFRDAVEQEELRKSPDLAHHAAVNGWNLAIRLIPEWPRIRLIPPSKQRRVRLPATTLPQSFHDSLAHLLASMAKPNPFEEGGRTRPLRQATIEAYRDVLLRFAADLVASGFVASEITEVAVLYAPDNAERGLTRVYERTGEKKTRGIGQAAALLRALANRDARITAEGRARVAALAALISPPPQRCMTPKNRGRLRALDQPGKLIKLLTLPEQMHRKKSNHYRDAVARETALAIALLIVCPVRVKNIATIHLERNLERFGDGKMYLRFEEEEIKNSIASEFEVPPDLARMITRHVAARSPTLCPSNCDWLFPLRKGAGPVGSADLSTRISKLIRRETGLEVNPHLFRHQAAKIWLDENPGSYEAVRRLLGHSDLSHTLNLYTGLETRSATRAFADLIASKKSPRRK